MNSGDRRLVGAALLILTLACLAFNINAVRLEGLNIFNLVGVTFSGGAIAIAFAVALRR